MAIMKKAQDGATTRKKVINKKSLPHPNDDYKNMVDPMTGKKGTMGGEGVIPPFGGPKPKKGTKVFNGVTGKYDTVKKNGGKVTKAKNGKSFPDLNKDGKITKADVLKGRGVIAKKGATIKKAQNGIKAEPKYEKGLLERAGPMRKTKTKERSPDGDYVKKTVTRTRKGATTTSSKTRRTLQGVMNGAPSVSSMKSGGSMKKCKGGC